MALPRKIQIDGRWCVDPGTGDAPVYCASSTIADQVVAAILAGGFWELTLRVGFGEVVPPSEVIKVKRG